MNNKKSTKRALISSILALALCMTMLIGTTFAWFTDSVSSNNNKIQAGNLDVELYLWDGSSTPERISTKADPIFGSTTGLAQNSEADSLWEPGKTQVAYLSIKNEGSLDLKYKVAIDVEDVSNNLYEVMEYAITPDAKYGDVKAWTEGTGVVPGVNYTEKYNDIALKAGEEHFFALSIHMDEEAGNQYQNGAVEFDIKVLAGQLASEEDSFNNQYDALASYAGLGYAAKPEENQSAVEVIVENDDSVTIGSFVFPASTIATTADKVSVRIDESVYKANITVDANSVVRAYEITVEGMKEGNTTPVKSTLNLPQGLDPATVAIYHYNTKIASTYDPYTGYLVFETASFSPFTVVYATDSEYVPTNPGGNNLPKPVVVASPEYVNTDIEWGSYGAWSPTAGLNSKLDAAYTFSCPTEGDDSEYLNWECDFYVSLDRDLGENDIFLGGNYGSFGWVGFHNGEVTLKANEEIALLGSVTSNPWTYSQVKDFVGTFICGVGAVDDDLKGATFTVKLRLTNPEKKTEFYDVSTINYTFK